jgi:hypothetical protein
MAYRKFVLSESPILVLSGLGLGIDILRFSY